MYFFKVNLTAKTCKVGALHSHVNLYACHANAKVASTFFLTHSMSYPDLFLNTNEDYDHLYGQSNSYEPVLSSHHPHVEVSFCSS